MRILNLPSYRLMIKYNTIIPLIPAAAMVKLLVVEDHALVREGLVQTLLQLEAEVDICAVADSEGANALLEHGHVFDLILLDLGLPGVDGFSCLRTFHQRYPAMPIVILSAYDDPHTVNKVMKRGAASFVPKTYSSDRLLAVLREVLSGRVFSPDLLPASFVAIPSPAANGGDVRPSEFGLSKRKSEILGLMVCGKSNRDIAELLGLSEGTIKVHLTGVFKALGVSSRTQAMVVVARHGIKF